MHGIGAAYGVENNVSDPGRAVSKSLKKFSCGHVVIREPFDQREGWFRIVADGDDCRRGLQSQKLVVKLFRIVTRVGSEESRPKLLRAGADAVVSSKTIGALRLASEMLRPHVVSVLDAMLREPSAVRVEEVPVGAAVAGRALGTLRLQERAGVIVFAMRAGADRHHVFNPPTDRALQVGDVLIACADHDQLEAMRRIAAEG